MAKDKQVELPEIEKLWSKTKKSVLSNCVKAGKQRVKDEFESQRRETQEEVDADLKQLRTIFKTFDGGLTAIVTKVRKAKSHDEAIEYCEKAHPVVRKYKQAVRAFCKSRKWLAIKAETVLDGALTKIEKYLAGVKQTKDILN